MILGLILASLTAAVVIILLRAMLRRRGPESAGSRDHERSVYRDQLAELERDRQRGMIGEAEAEAARNEISRRLLQTMQEEPQAPAHPGLARARMLALLLVPVVALPVYFAIGNPGQPDVPLQQRLADAVANKDMPAMIAQVERQLEKTPDDVRGWQTLVPVYQAEKRFADAANAYANIIRLAPPDARLLTEYADMMMLANDGDIPPVAHEALRRALALDPKNAKARFFDALAFKQEGKREEARSRMQALLAEAPADAPYRQMVEAELKQLAAAKAPSLTQEQLAAGSAMNSQDQAAMIGNMIDGLEQRLGATSTDLEGWMRLIRARSVNKQQDKAVASLALARTIFKDQPAALNDLGALAAELGLTQ